MDEATSRARGVLVPPASAAGTSVRHRSIEGGEPAWPLAARPPHALVASEGASAGAGRSAPWGEGSTSMGNEAEMRQEIGAHALRLPWHSLSVHSVLPAWPSVYNPGLPERCRGPRFPHHRQVFLGEGRAESSKGVRPEASSLDMTGEGGYRCWSWGVV